MLSLDREPILVRLLDLDSDESLTDLRRPPEAAIQYRSALLFVRRQGTLLGSVLVPFEEEAISSAVLRREMARQFGADWMRPLPTKKVVTPLPSATLVIPTAMTRPEHLRACVGHLQRLDYPDYEIIVVDNRRAGADVDVPGARVVRQPRPGCSAARNAGLGAAEGEIVAFVDDDVRVDSGWLRAFAERFVTQPELTALTGMVLPATLDSRAEVLFERSNNSGDRIYEPLEFRRVGRFRVRRESLANGDVQIQPLYATGDYGSSATFAFRTAQLRAVGGFDVALGPGTLAPAGEDLELLVRLLIEGHRLGYEPGAIVHHAHRVGIDELEHQVRSYGIGLTAMLTAIVSRYPHHLIGLLSMLPRAARVIWGRDTGDAQERLPDDDDLAQLSS